MSCEFFSCKNRCVEASTTTGALVDCLRCLATDGAHRTLRSCLDNPNATCRQYAIWRCLSITRLSHSQVHMGYAQCIVVSAVPKAWITLKGYLKSRLNVLVPIFPY